MADRQLHDTSPRGSKVVMAMQETKFETELETETIRQLSGCVRNLHTVQATKQSLLVVTPAEVLAALECRRLLLSESS